MKTHTTQLFALFLLALIGCGEDIKSGGSAEDSINSEIGVLKTYRFTQPRSCRKDDVDGSYETSALFLSEASLDRNDPQLLYVGLCDSEGAFSVNQNGGDKRVGIADLDATSLGDIEIEDILETPLVFDKNIEVEHIYGVWDDGNPTRVIFAFRVIEFEQGGEILIEYIVLAKETGDFEETDLWEYQADDYEQAGEERDETDETSGENEKTDETYQCTCYQDEEIINQFTSENNCVLGGTTPETAAEEAMSQFNELCGTNLTTNSCGLPSYELGEICTASYECQDATDVYYLRCE